MDDTLITTAEAASLLGVTPRTVQRAISRGALTPVATAGGHLLSRRDVIAYRDSTYAA